MNNVVLTVIDHGDNYELNIGKASGDDMVASLCIIAESLLAIAGGKYNRSEEALEALADSMIEGVKNIWKNQDE